MELLTPALGLFFWTLVVFAIVFFVLRKFAWRPILQSLKDREDKIEGSLQMAENARKEMELLKADNEKLLNEARAERDKILKEAKEISDTLVAQAKQKADIEGKRLIESAQDSINKEKEAAKAEIKELVAALSIEMAEKILKKKFENPAEQEQLVKDYLQNATLN
ncbi:MAG: F0F1 ATP synthase subunit B [Bacteroidetes bacterium]|nr:MAG: F0F1 ATP synthase subunit B [Bacteroidota bacterium]